MTAPRKKIEAAPAVMLLEADAKRFATLQARCALRGVQLSITTDDYERPLYVGVKWAMVATFSNLDDLAAWVHRVDGQSE